MTPQVYKSNLNLVLSILVNGTISFIKLGNLNNQLCLCMWIWLLMSCSRQHDDWPDVIQHVCFFKGKQ